MISEHKVAELVAEKFSEKEYSHCFMVEAELEGSQVLRVFIDSEKGVSFAECKALSRFLEDKIESASLMDSNYLLEVSSPGVDRPLKFIEQYPKHVGRKFELDTSQGIQIGVLRQIKGEILVFEKEKPKTKRKKDKDAEDNFFETDFKSIKSARVLISF